MAATLLRTPAAPDDPIRLRVLSGGRGMIDLSTVHGMRQITIRATPSTLGVVTPITSQESDRLMSISGALPYGRKLSRPLVIVIEQDEGEILVSEPRFHMHAVSQTEAEAIEGFRRILSGYVDVLENRKDTLGPALQTQLAYLRKIVESQ